MLPKPLSNRKANHIGLLVPMVTRLDLGGAVHATTRLTGYGIAWLESGVVPWVLGMGDT